MYDAYYTIKVPHHGTKAYFNDFSCFELKHLFISNAHRGTNSNQSELDEWRIFEEYSNNDTKMHCSNCANCKSGKCICELKTVIHGNLVASSKEIKDILD